MEFPGALGSHEEIKEGSASLVSTCKRTQERHDRGGKRCRMFEVNEMIHATEVLVLGGCLPGVG